MAQAVAPGLLPHQHHRKLGTVKKTAEHIARVKAAQKRESGKANDEKRSSKWPGVRKKFLQSPEVAAQGCAACGAKQGLQVHHKKPFHADPTLELNPTNLIALCEVVGGLECHEFIGHGGHNGGFKRYNPNVEKDAADLRAHPDQLVAIQARVAKNSLVNAPGD